MLMRPCPSCAAPHDLSARLSRDWVWCDKCDRWFMVVFSPGHIELLPVGAPPGLEASAAPARKVRGRARKKTT